VNPKTGLVYVTYSDIDAVTVIDTGEIIATIPVPPGGNHTLAVNAATNVVYVTNPNADSVSVIDGVTSTTVTTILVEVGAANEPLAAIVVNPATNRVYTSWRSEDGLGVAVIDGTTNSLHATVPLDGVAYLLAADEVRNQVFAIIELYAQTFRICPELRMMAVIDGAKDTITDCVGVDPVWNGALTSATGSKRLYLAAQTGQFPRYTSTLSVIDSTTHGTVATAVIPQSVPAGVAVNPRSDRVYLIANDWPDGDSNPGQSGRLLAADGDTGEIIWSQPFDSAPTAVAVDPETNTVYVATADRTLHVIPD